MRNTAPTAPGAVRADEAARTGAPVWGQRSLSRWAIWAGS